MQRFNPSLGTLHSVQISSDVSYNSSITITNLSQVTPATGITAMLSGASYQIGGLGPVADDLRDSDEVGDGADLPVWNGKPGQEPTDTIDLSVEDKQNLVLTSAQDLAFYTAQAAQTTLTPTMTGLGGGVASARMATARSRNRPWSHAQLTITYTYIPSAPCLINPGQYKLVQVPTPPGVIDGKASENGVVFPNPGSPQMLLVTVNTTSDNLINNDFGKLTASPPVPGMITRFGVHHQRTRLVLPFTGTVDPTLASNPKNYVVIASPTLHIPVVSAKFNPATNAVTLIPARRLNFRSHYVLSFHLPTPNGALVNLPFGGEQDLGGFLTRTTATSSPCATATSSAGADEPPGGGRWLRCAYLKRWRGPGSSRVIRTASGRILAPEFEERLNFVDDQGDAGRFSWAGNPGGAGLRLTGGGLTREAPVGRAPPIVEG